MSNKTITQESYQATAEAFAKNVESMAPMESIEKFIALLPSDAKIIDIGCGSGRDAKIFTDRGVSVVGIDFCESMLKIAKVHAPLADFQLMDIEDLSFQEGSFDGVWAACSLCHIAKSDFPSLLSKIHSLLKNEGFFYLTLKKGEGEVLEKDLRYGEFEKFWSFYKEEEILKLVSDAKFKVLECTTVEKRFAYQSHACIRIFCQK